MQPSEAIPQVWSPRLGPDRLDVRACELTIASMSEPPSSTSGLVRALGGMALQGFKDALGRSNSSKAESGPVPARGAPEPPVVAQLMIEIRSDGSHTIARGALHDLRSNESAHVHAEGKTPQQLIASLLGSLLSLPAGTFQKLRNPAEGKHETRVEVLPRDPKER